MAITDIKLTLMPFPQRWDGSSIDLRVLVAPRGDPTLPLTAGAPAFAESTLALNALLIPGLGQLPTPANVTATLALPLTPPANAKALFDQIKARENFNPSPPPVTPPASSTSFLKQLMPSYQAAFPFERPRTPFAFTDDTYACALRSAVGGDPATTPVPPGTTWGRILSLLLRQPLAAEALGLLYIVRLTPPDPAFFVNGGWIYLALANGSDYAAQQVVIPDLVKSYAARIPALSTKRPVFAPVLFPVRTSPGPGDFDEIFREVELYDDGFAKIVHTFQSDRDDLHDLSNAGSDALRPVDEVGVRLGWDDEQVVIWMNRQLTDDPRNSATGRDTPLGVRSYRVDVREPALSSSWNSLVHVSGELSYAGVDLGKFDGDLGVDITPAQLLGNKDGDYWLPTYFAKWPGTSLVLRDPLLNQLADTPSTNVSPMKPAGEDAVRLRYGHDYDFRVRFMDASGGGPTESDEPFNPAVAGIGRCNFRRFVPPKISNLSAGTVSPDGRSATFAVDRPLLGYPGLVFTDFPNAAAKLLADVPAAKADSRAVGLPDPDVTILRIDVAVGGLEFDPENIFERGVPAVSLYTASRAFPADPTQPVTLEFEFQDTTDIATFPAPTKTGALLLPTSRDVIVTFTPICRMDPTTLASGAPDPALEPIPDQAALDLVDPKLAYFGYEAARVGMPRTIRLRAEAQDEKALLGEVPGMALQGIMLQPDPKPDAYLLAARAAAGDQGSAATDLAQRLASATGLASEALTYKGGPGRRVAFGCSAALRSTLAPDRSSVVFSSKADLTGHWVMVLELILERDWTWDGLDDLGFEVARTIGGSRVVVGYISVPRSVSALAVRADSAVDRTQTKLVFFDAIDPKPASGGFPAEIQATYEVTPRFRSAPASVDGAWTRDITLPIAARPAQTPSLVSAGIALSPYQHDEAYSQTQRRQRMLWLEFSEPVLDPDDLYFGRVLAHAVDPMLTRFAPEPLPGPDEPPLPIDPELIRIITPGQSDDFAGLDAMQPLVVSDSPTKFGLPLPPSLTEADPELFGFFSYELRVGHAKNWSTAQARFGLPLQVTGIQHPAPPLPCQAVRTVAEIVVNAPYAVPISNGKNYSTDPPLSQIWALLYVQVAQVDGDGRRNLLLSQSRANISDRQFRGRSGAVYGHAVWDQSEIAARLEQLGLPSDSSLSVLAVELLPEQSMIFDDPLGGDLGEVRILRTSPLTPVPAVCEGG